MSWLANGHSMPCMHIGNYSRLSLASTFNAQIFDEPHSAWAMRHEYTLGIFHFSKRMNFKPIQSVSFSARSTKDRACRVILYHTMPCHEYERWRWWPCIWVDVVTNDLGSASFVLKLFVLDHVFHVIYGRRWLQRHRIISITQNDWHISSSHYFYTFSVFTTISRCGPFCHQLRRHRLVHTQHYNSRECICTTVRATNTIIINTSLHVVTFKMKCINSYIRSHGILSSTSPTPTSRPFSRSLPLPLSLPLSLSLSFSICRSFSATHTWIHFHSHMNDWTVVPWAHRSKSWWLVMAHWSKRKNAEVCTLHKRRWTNTSDDPTYENKSLFKCETTRAHRTSHIYFVWQN